jgi:surface carbohydrate biosynthesis protein
MIRYISKIIYIFFFSKKNFTKPKKVDVLFYDTVGFFFLKKLLPKKVKYDVLDIRYSSINIIVIISYLKKFFLNYNSYIQEYINFTKPKIIITNNDNDIYFYLLKKKNPNIKFISIQNGKRNSEFFEKIKKIKYLEADYIFCFGDYIKKKYNSYIKSKVVSVGSLKNNFINILRKKYKFCSYISEYDLSNANVANIKKNISRNYFYNKIQEIILKLLIDYCKSINKKLVIILRPNYSKQEKNYFLSIRNKYYKKITLFYPKNQISTYKKCDQSEFVVATNSTLGLENIVRGGKTLFINPRPLLFKVKDDNFFWPGKTKPLMNKIYINKIKNLDFNKFIKSFCKISFVKYCKAIKFYKIMNYDKDNRIIKKVILSFL